MKNISRRQMLFGLGTAMLSAGSLKSIARTVADRAVSASRPLPDGKPYRLSINTATISHYKLPVEEQISLCAKAGYDGIELWMRDIEAYMEKGGKLPDLRKRLDDSGLVYENTIGFAEWMAGEKGMEQMRREMEITAQLGARCIAATASGMKSIDRNRLDEYAGMYARILETGVCTGVRPILEIWGAGVLNQLSDALHIAAGSKHPNAALLLDFYHLYRGGNSYDSLRLVNGSAMPLFHLNDFPAAPPREQLADSDRVYPGDGICPFEKALPLLKASGFSGAFSLELFNETYWKNPNPMTVLKAGYEKSRNIIERYFK
ncbi:MAG: sugar phosphate isomerase/epimerase [Tannerellaceae bacterium]|nr:sugar phosphate isomerase/epimerase [Tannerellaceae bacterium]